MGEAQLCLKKTKYPCKSRDAWLECKVHFPRKDAEMAGYCQESSFRTWRELRVFHCCSFPLHLVMDLAALPNWSSPLGQ